MARKTDALPVGRKTPDVQRTWAMPSHNTFSIKPIKQFVKHYLHSSKSSIDPFARNNRWATYTNDLNPDTAAESHLDAGAFLEELVSKQVKADLVIFDPPYSSNQIVECYKNIGLEVNNLTFEDYSQLGRWKKEKALINKLLTDEGVFLHFGWHTNGMGLRYGFQIERILMVAHGAAHYDTLCMAERRMKTQPKMF